jgi:predicted DNA-binding protein (UPF0251 family)
MKKQGKQGKELVEPIDFNKLRENLKTIMEEVDRRLESEYDAFSPKMWAKLRERVDLTVLEIKAVRLALNGMGTVEVANKLGVKRQQVAAVLAFNTMLQHDYADAGGVRGVRHRVLLQADHLGSVRQGRRCSGQALPRVPAGTVPVVHGRGVRGGLPPAEKGPAGSDRGRSVSALAA